MLYLDRLLHRLSVPIIDHRSRRHIALVVAFALSSLSYYDQAHAYDHTVALERAEKVAAQRKMPRGLETGKKYVNLKMHYHPEPSAGVTKVIITNTRAEHALAKRLGIDMRFVVAVGKGRAKDVTALRDALKGIAKVVVVDDLTYKDANNKNVPPEQWRGDSFETLMRRGAGLSEAVIQAAEIQNEETVYAEHHNYAHKKHDVALIAEPFVKKMRERGNPIDFRLYLHDLAEDNRPDMMMAKLTATGKSDVNIANKIVYGALRLAEVSVVTINHRDGDLFKKHLPESRIDVFRNALEPSHVEGIDQGTALRWRRQIINWGKAQGFRLDGYSHTDPNTILVINRKRSFPRADVLRGVFDLKLMEEVSRMLHAGPPLKLLYLFTRGGTDDYTRRVIEFIKRYVPGAVVGFGDTELSSKLDLDEVTKAARMFYSSAPQEGYGLQIPEAGQARIPLRGFQFDTAPSFAHDGMALLLYTQRLLNAARFGIDLERTQEKYVAGIKQIYWDAGAHEVAKVLDFDTPAAVRHHFQREKVKPAGFRGAPGLEFGDLGLDQQMSAVRAIGGKYRSALVQRAVSTTRRLRERDPRSLAKEMLISDRDSHGIRELVAPLQGANGLDPNAPYPEPIEQELTDNLSVVNTAYDAYALAHDRFSSHGRKLAAIENKTVESVDTEKNIFVENMRELNNMRTLRLLHLEER